MKNILVTGGAGYIGSHACLRLIEAGWNVVILDNLSTGHSKFVTEVLKVDFIIGDNGDHHLLENLFTKYQFNAVMHFSSNAYVGESIEDPLKYYENNVCRTIVLLESMVKHGVKFFVFSSSCATFGQVEKVPIDEDHPQNPINPYGRTKLMVEQILQDMDAACGFRSICLRYFNASGADPLGRLGEEHDPETHLIPLVLDCGLDNNKIIKIFGNDYHTGDGTCVRDYVHVTDLAEAHLLALEYLVKNGKSDFFNLGNGKGASVKEIIGHAEKIMKKSIKCEVVQRRAGDPPILVSNSDKAKKVLGWAPKYNIEDIIAHAWSYRSRNIVRL